MSTVAVIPVKRFGRALRRLAGVLDRPERGALQAAMLTDLLGACTACPGLDGVIVVSRDPAAAALAHAHGARVVPDHDPPRGMNAAVGIGQRAAGAAGHDTVLVLTADLPLARPGDLTAILQADPGGDRCAVLVPSRHGTGTNALLIRPGTAIDTHLGVDSRARHRRALAAARVPLTELTLPWVGLDIDTPQDLGLLLGAPHDTHARRECLRMGIDGRLVAGIGS